MSMRCLAGFLVLAFACIACIACGSTTNGPPPAGTGGGLTTGGTGGNPITNGTGGGLTTGGTGGNPIIDGIPGTACTPGTNTGLSCYFCQCSQDGIWDCIDDCGAPPVCSAGTVKVAGDGCNVCECDGSGWNCTDAACPEPTCPVLEPCPGFETYGRVKGTDVCCELCSAADDRYTFYDSMASCQTSASQACHPDVPDVVDEACNSCTCLEDGSFACSNNVCILVDCGGAFGNPCAEDEYCNYLANLNACGVSGQITTCQKRPVACSATGTAVCGCDGNTYANECLANLAGHGIYTNQPCLPGNMGGGPPN